MQHEQKPYPLYQYCLFSNISKYKDKLISVVGKVTEINSDEQFLIIEVDPTNGRSLKIIVPQFQVSYLFDQGALHRISDKQDLIFAQNFIKNSNKQNTLRNQTSQNGNYTSLMWFTLQQNELLNKKKPADKQVQKNGINAASLCKKINVGQFYVNQYIEVRGRCLNDRTVQMEQFTNFDENYDLEAHNYALSLGLQYCQKIMG